MTNLDAALQYASRGLMVFPCGIDKKPLTANGFKSASKDLEQIRAWWTDNPSASIGMPTGPENGLWVLDIDMPDGPKSLYEIEKKNARVPDTLIQKTGGGGVQYFWKWNGRDIRNSSSKIGKNIDVRGNGGYVILPPSGHLSGGKYEWAKKRQAIEAPAWLADLALGESTPEIRKAKPAPLGTTKYGQAAMLGEIRILRQQGEGSRNDQLNRAAFCLGQLVAGGELDEFEATTMLTTTAQALGLDTKEIPATLKSGMESGKKYERTAPETTKDYFDFGDGNQSNQSNQSNHLVSKESKVITGNQSVIISNQPLEKSNVEHAYNLHSLIGDWINNSTGYFTNEQVDREFNLTTRAEKINRAKSLYIYKKNKLIRADKKIKGRWHVIDNKIEWVDLNAVEDTAFPILLPFDLHNKISIPTKSIIVLAGTTNAGKTAFILQTLLLNIDQGYDRMYLMSEMGGAEYKHRVVGTGCPINKWAEKIKAAPKSYDFNGAIQNFNPDGLTCIDYLEEIDGEYFKIASSIRDIYDSLGDGVALIAIQKKGGGEFGRGGEATAEKARLYMTIDFLCSLDHCIICALKIVKAKHSLRENMIGKEIHFKIERGSAITPITEWQFSGRINRATCIAKYEREGGVVHDYVPFQFRTKDGATVTLSRQDHESWKIAYPRFDVDRELRKIQDTSHEWVTKDNWIFQVGGLINKKAGGRK